MKKALSKVSIPAHSTYNRFCVLDINAYNDESCTRNESAVHAVKILQRENKLQLNVARTYDSFRVSFKKGI